MTARNRPSRLTATQPGQLTGDAAPAPTVETIAAQAATVAATAAATGSAGPGTPAPVAAPTVAPVAAAAPAPVTPAPVATPAPGAVSTAPASTVTGSAAAAPTPVTAGRPRLATVRAAAQLVAAANRGEIAPHELTAALMDLTPANQPGASQDQWIGQLWEGVQYRRRFVEAITTGAPVRALNVKGWRWKTPPVVAPYTGNKAAVPSNPAETEPVEVPVQRLAGAHDIDRAFFDLGDDEYVAAYWAAMAESYAYQSDRHCSQLLAAGAADTGAHDSALSGIVQVAIAVMGVGTPSFVAIGTDVFAGMAATNEKDALAFLAGSLSLDGTGDLGGVDLFVSPQIAANAVLGGVRQAATFHELNPALRVTVANVAQGGIDAGLFGYTTTVTHNDGGLARGTVTAAAPVAARK